MERLTQDTDKGVSLILDSPKNDAEARAQVTARFMTACNRLAAYEHTGLDPAGVERLKTDNAELRRQLIALTKKQEY